MHGLSGGGGGNGGGGGAGGGEGGGGAGGGDGGGGSGGGDGGGEGGGDGGGTGGGDGGGDGGGGDGGGEGGGGDGGGMGGIGGGGAQSAESPANSRLRPVQPGVLERTANVPSTKPCFARKKSCRPLLACASVSARGSVGLSNASPRAVAVNVAVLRSTLTVEVIGLFDAGRRGVR